jgi:16S rRNA (uracil1498-N3)-methyltransferase
MASGSAPGRERRGGEPPPRFIISAEDVREGIVRLAGSEGHHAKNVLRLVRGDRFVAIDGRGAEYEAVVQILTGDGLIGEVVRTSRRSREPVTQLTLAQALAKPATLAEAVKDATALGVWRFLLFECARVETREISPRELDHLRGVTAAAAKQSLRAVVPEITPPVAFNELLKAAAGFERAVICTPHPQAASASRILGSRHPRPSRILVAVGPEGGFDEEEERRALNAGFHPLHLGPRRLRSELAGIVAAALLFNEAGDLGPAGES